MATEPTENSAGYFNLFATEPTIPDANELLSLKILKDANPSAFQTLAHEETKWLSISLGLLRQDPYLQVMMQGKGVRQAMKLSSLLKQKAEQMHFDNRVKGVVKKIVEARFRENGWEHLKPNKNADFVKGYGQGHLYVDVDGLPSGVNIMGTKTSESYYSKMDTIRSKRQNERMNMDEEDA